jgi:hypothetical protein
MWIDVGLEHLGTAMAHEQDKSEVRKGHGIDREKGIAGSQE